MAARAKKMLDEHPVAAEWHPTKNGELRPENVAVNSSVYAWWQCPKGPDHVWRTRVNSRTILGRGCLACAGRQISVTNCLATLEPAIAAELHPHRNDGKTASDFFAYTSAAVWWQCARDPSHEWRVSISARTRQGNGCPQCAGQRVTSQNSLASRRPDLVAELHPTRSAHIDPKAVVSGSAQRVWWKCQNGPDHEWEDSLNHRDAGRGCPFCASQRVSITNCLATIAPHVAAEWHPARNGDTTPRDVLARSNKLYWWRCTAGPDHEWEAPPNQRLDPRGGGCPFCRGLRVSVTNSLAGRAPALSKEWHPSKNGRLLPSQVVAGSHRLVWWQCARDADHVWRTPVKARAIEGLGCPECTLAQQSKSEIRLSAELALFFEVAPLHDKPVVRSRRSGVDIALPKIRVVVEYDGWYWHKDKIKSDIAKTRALESLGWRVLRVREEGLPLIGALDVAVPCNANSKRVANAVLTRLQDALGITVPNLEAYLSMELPQNSEIAEQKITKALASRRTRRRDKQGGRKTTRSKSKRVR